MLENHADCAEKEMRIKIERKVDFKSTREREREKERRRDSEMIEEKARERVKLTFPKLFVNVTTTSTMKIINESDGKFTVFIAFSRSLRIIALAFVRHAIVFGLFSRFFLALGGVGASLPLCSAFHHQQFVPKS